MVRGLPVEDRLDGALNYGSWKTRVLITLEEYDVVLDLQKKKKIVWHLGEDMM
jgi:hypothetical protein